MMLSEIISGSALEVFIQLDWLMANRSRGLVD